MSTYAQCNDKPAAGLTNRPTLFSPFQSSQPWPAASARWQSKPKSFQAKSSRRHRQRRRHRHGKAARRFQEISNKNCKYPKRV